MIVPPSYPGDSGAQAKPSADDRASVLRAGDACRTRCGESDVPQATTKSFTCARTIATTFDLDDDRLAGPPGPARIMRWHVWRRHAARGERC